VSTDIKHPVPDRVKPSFVIFDALQSAQMSKITTDGFTESGTGCFIAVPTWQQWASSVNNSSVYCNCCVTFMHVLAAVSHSLHTASSSIYLWTSVGC